MVTPRDHDHKYTQPKTKTRFGEQWRHKAITNMIILLKQLSQMAKEPNKLFLKQWVAYM